jgi:hypothetical protein
MAGAVRGVWWGDTGAGGRGASAHQHACASCASERSAAKWRTMRCLLESILSSWAGGHAHVMRALREGSARARLLCRPAAHEGDGLWRCACVPPQRQPDRLPANLSPPPPIPLTDFNMVRIACPRLALPALRARRYFRNGPSALAMRCPAPAQQRTCRQARLHRTASLCCTARHCLPHRRSSKAAAVLRLCGSTLPRGAAALASGRRACCWREAGMSGAARLGSARPRQSNVARGARLRGNVVAGGHACWQWRGCACVAVLQVLQT